MCAVPTSNYTTTYRSVDAVFSNPYVAFRFSFPPCESLSWKGALEDRGHEVGQPTQTSQPFSCRAYGLTNDSRDLLTPLHPRATVAMTASSARDPSPQKTFKFPAFQPDLMPMPEEEYGQISSRTTSPSHAAQTNGGAIPADRWQPRKEARFGYMNGAAPGPATRHGRQKSLSEDDSHAQGECQSERA
jgi:hypothetical protein